MKLKQILKSKSGVAIENAVMFILVIFSLCALLTSLTLIGHYQVKYEKNILKQDIEIDQIGEDFLKYLASNPENKEFTLNYDNYTYQLGKSESIYKLTVWLGTDDEDKTPENVLLYVEAVVTVTDGKVIVNKWRYSLP